MLLVLEPYIPTHLRFTLAALAAKEEEESPL
jgi:hypothetical protein